MIADANTNRKGARDFLKGLEQYLDRSISHSLVRESVKASKGPNYESDFVNAFMLPKISEYFRQTLSPAEAVTAFLTESVDARKQERSSGTPASSNKHLFTKVYRCAGQDSGGNVVGNRGKEAPLPKLPRLGFPLSVPAHRSF